MKKIISSIMKFYLLILITSFLFIFLSGYSYLISKSEKINLIIIFLILLAIYVIIEKVITIIIEKDNEIIKKVSTKYEDLLDLNDKYDFVDLGQIHRKIKEREYSHKSFDRARANSIILYKLENNDDNIREFILDAYRNKKTYDAYIKEFENIDSIVDEKTLQKIKFSRKKYDRVEKRVIEEALYNENVYDIKINVIVYYTTPSGQDTYKKNKVFNYDELCDLYMQWRNGKKYAETAKRERRYLTDSMRYDVLKRDNFTCKKCGATADDGIKLHVDHIIPVSKGGRTTMSNLQTLCERCNIGKSNKEN